MLIGQQDRVDELNTRLASRHFPDSPLAPNFDPRPVTTKYSRFPALDRRAPTTVPIKPTNPFETSHFYPGTRAAPSETYLRNVDLETSLKLNRSLYVPSSQSDLYKISFPTGPPLAFPGLFEKPTLVSTRKLDKVGTDLFFNHTRVQLRL